VAVHVSSGNAKVMCPACNAPGMEAIRKQEGCDVVQVFGQPFDGKGARPLFAITCSACSGSKHDCEVCLGSGEERVYQCPGTLRSIHVNEALRAFASHDHGVLPDPGSLYEQSAPFVDVVGIISSESARLQRESMRHSRAKKPRKGGGGGGGKRTPNRV